MWRLQFLWIAYRVHFKTWAQLRNFLDGVLVNYFLHRLQNVGRNRIHLTRDFDRMTITPTITKSKMTFTAIKPLLTLYLYGFFVTYSRCLNTVHNTRTEYENYWKIISHDHLTWQLINNEYPCIWILDRTFNFSSIFNTATVLLHLNNRFCFVCSVIHYLLVLLSWYVLHLWASKNWATMNIFFKKITVTRFPKI